jgi:hypothetical protein
MNYANEPKFLRQFLRQFFMTKDNMSKKSFKTSRLWKKTQKFFFSKNRAPDITGLSRKPQNLRNIFFLILS